ncbi:uncharacterized protein LOC117338859 [Pecten maximus]|uniref:uncharacterized protein LOC117338859 n=1 Tax=Pecten maximus TaxID=6579 RepID=UPI001458F532|nr:uncharacterized protein LOC117338859 [Pecten maximus]
MPSGYRISQLMSTIYDGTSRNAISGGRVGSALPTSVTDAWKPQSPPKEIGKKISSLSPIIIQKTIKGCLGTAKSVKPLRLGDLLVEVFRKQQADNLLKLSEFSGIGVHVRAHQSLNFSKGVIRCTALQNDTDAEILQYFKSENIPISEVRRIKIKRQTVKTNTFVHTFAVPNLPSSVMVGYMRCNVLPYIPNPLRCRNCQRYGHHEDRCRRREVCEHCGREGHNDTDSCDVTGKLCPNCKGNHAASSRDCLSWKKEREVLRVKYTRNISFPDARRVVKSNDPAALSYASVTKSKTQQNTITVSDAKLQAYFDKPAFGAEVPPLMDERNDKILFGLASRFKSGRVASKTTSTSARPSKSDDQDQYASTSSTYTCTPCNSNIEAEGHPPQPDCITAVRP